MKRYLLLALVVLVVLAGCGQRKEVVAYLEDSQSILERWSDAYDRAASTGRIALAPVIGELQEVRRDFGDLDPPEDAAYMHSAVLDAMNFSIDGFLLFMADEDEAEVSRLFSLAERSMGWAFDDLDELREEYGLKPPHSSPPKLK